MKSNPALSFLHRLPHLALGLWLATAFAAPAAAAPAPQDPDDGSRNAAAEDARLEPAKRILRLTDGRVLRLLARWSTDRWEVCSDGEWRSLDPGGVVRWRDEAEVLKEYRRLAGDVGPREYDRRAALAEWLVSQGLVDEALAELDAVLSAEPDHPAALKGIRTAPFSRPSGGDPEADPRLYARRLVDAGTSAGAARRELCILSLGALLESEAQREVLEEVLAAELVAYRPLRRTFAAHALRRLLPGEQVRELLRRSALDTSRPVREAASLALHDTGEPGVVLPLIRALGSESRAVRTNAAESLGNVGFAVAVPALVSHFGRLPISSGSGGTRPVAANLLVSRQFAYVGDFDVEIAQGASIADPIVMVGEEGVVLDARVGGISGYTKLTEYRVVRASLRQLTGEDAGATSDAWRSWYEANRERFEPKPREAPVTTGGSPPAR